MNILGLFEIKKTEGGIGFSFGRSKKAFSTSFVGNGVAINGESVAQNYSTFWRMYKNNTDIFRCIEEKIQTSMKRGFELQKENSTDGRRKVAQDPQFIKALGDVDELKKLIIMAFDIFGDVFIRSRVNLRGAVIGYEVLDTREVSVITDSDLKPIRYAYRRKTPTSMRIESYPADLVRHYKTGHNWDNSIFGYTVLATLIYDALGDDEASKVNYFWYLNDAVPSSLYVLKEGLSVDEQAKAIEDVQDTLKGSHNAGKSMVTNAITKVEPIARNESGLQDIEKRKFATEKICAGLGVPRSVLNYIEDVNYSNGDIQLKKFIENTIQPLERTLEKIFTDLSKDFLGYYFVIDSEHIDQMEQKSKLARENVAGGVWTINEARAYAGDYENIGNDLADEILVPSTLQILDNLLLGEPEIPVPDTVKTV